MAQNAPLQVCCDDPCAPVISTPETIATINCDGAISNVTFPSPLERVVIVQDKPFVICSENPIQIEVGGYEACYSGVEAHIEIIRNEDDSFNRYVAHLKDGTGTIIDPATATLISNCPKAPEIDYIHTNWLPFCVDGIQWYAGEEYSFNNTTAVKTYIGKVYKEGALGVPTNTLPTGTLIVDGICEKCKIDKQFEFGYYKTLPVAVSGKAIGFKNGVNADFAQLISGNYEVYFVIDGVPQQGNGAGAGYGADYPLVFNSLQDIANYFNNHPANTSVKDTWVVDNTSGAEALVINETFGGGTSNHIWSDMVVAHYDSAGINDYNHFKDTPATVLANVNITGGCRKIEILKELDCNGILTLKGFEINGTPIIPFDVSLVFNEDASKSQRDICINTTAGEIWNVVELTETSPCGVTTVKYMDMDTSPITDVTSLFASFRHNGECGCCEDKV
jgi:hypothetical protein